MKKIIGLFLISFIVLPFAVNAETKTFNGYKYTIEEKSYNDYICDQIEGKDYHFFTNHDNTSVVLSLLNEAPAYDYLIDFTKNNNCNPISTEDYNKLFPDVYYKYEWGKDNVIRKVKITNQDDRYFIKTNDTTIDTNKIYYSLYDLTMTEVKNPRNEDILSYYETIYLAYVQSSGDYDANTEYYVQNNDGTVSFVGKIDQATFNNGESYLTKTANIEREEILTLTNEDFIVPKELGILSEDLVYDRSDELEVVTVGDKTYLRFVEENLGDPFVFDVDGNLVKFGFDKVMSPSGFEVTKNNNILLLIGPDYQQMKYYVMDSSFNIIFEKDYNDDYIEYLTSINNTDYFVLDSYIDNNFDKKIIKITKEKETLSGSSEAIANPNTIDNITTSIIIGILSLVGLTIIIICLRKKSKTRAN